MKKLMTMLATAAMAFGLYADTPSIISGAGFDSSDKGTPSLLTWNASGFVNGFWTGTNAENAVITAGGLPSAYENRPAFFVKSVDPTRSYSDYLAVATKLGEEIGMNVKENGGAQIIGADGLYFDGLVKFTAFDEFPTIANDAKIAVFPMLNDPEDDSAGTNLYVKAWGTTTNIWKTATSIADEDWHRVTIKAIKDILAGDGTQVGFVVYVDGEMIGLPLGVKSDFKSATLTPEANYYNNNGFLFGALGTYSTSLTQVGFSGKGGIDEIVFTEVAPDFAKSPTFAEITVGSNINSFSIYEDGKLAGTYTTFPITIEKKDGVAYTYTYIAAPGYISVKAPTSLDLSQGSASIANATAAAALLGDEGYATIAAAVGEANKAIGPVVLKLMSIADNDKNVALNNANVTLDLNGLQGIGVIGIDGGAAITLTNSSDTVAAVDGCVWPTVAINSDKMKFLASENEDMSGDCSIIVSSFARNWELKKVGGYYVVSEKQTDPIPSLPDNPTADQVNAAVDAANFADLAVKEMIGGDSTEYNKFKTWAGTVTGGQAAVVESAHAADSYLLGLTKLLANAPVSKIETIAKTSDTELTLTFKIKDGADGDAVAAQANAYVQSLVKCAEDVGFATPIAATVNVSVSGTTLNAAVTLPANKPAAFMKVAK